MTGGCEHFPRGCRYEALARPGCNNTQKHSRCIPDISLERCNSLCAPLGFKFCGVQMGGTGCFCGDSFGSQGKADADADCNVRCAGDPKEVCGGPNLNSVYETVPVGEGCGS